MQTLDGRRTLAHSHKTCVCVCVCMYVCARAYPDTMRKQDALSLA